MNTCSAFEFIHSCAGTELLILINDLSLKNNVFSSRHNKLKESLKRKWKIYMSYRIMSEFLHIYREIVTMV
jgi:hypothetical protein